MSVFGGCTFTWIFFFLQVAGRWKGLCWHWRVHRDTWCVFTVLLKHSRLVLLQMQWGLLWTSYRRTYLQEARQDRTLAYLYKQVLCSKYVHRCIAVLAHSPGPYECCSSWFWLQGWIYVLLWCQCQDNIQVCFYVAVTRVSFLIPSVPCLKYLFIGASSRHQGWIATCTSKKEYFSFRAHVR